MLFFKQIKESKLSDIEFDDFYTRECHICSTTINIISQLETGDHSLTDALRTLDMSHNEYDRLKSGDHCNPKQVLKLCQFLGITEITPPENCKRQ